MNIGENIKNKRIEKKLSQEELANLCGLSKNGIWNYENTKRRPNLEVLMNIADALDVTLEDLIYGSNSIYINRLNRSGASIIRDVSQLSTQELIDELNSRDDFPIKINIKKDLP